MCLTMEEEAELEEEAALEEWYEQEMERYREDRVAKGLPI